MTDNVKYLFVEQVKEKLKKASVVSVTQLQFDELLKLEPAYKQIQAGKSGVIVTEDGRQIKLIKPARVYYIDGKYKNADYNEEKSY